MNNEQQPTCPMCGSPVKVVLGDLTYVKHKTNSDIRKAIEFLCMNKRCESATYFYGITKEEVLKRFSSRPESAYHKAWNRLKEVLRFSYDQGIVQNDYDGGYKAGIEKCHREIRQIEKELKHE